MAYVRELQLTYRRKRIDDDLLAESVDSAAQAHQFFKEMQNEAREKSFVCI